MKRRQWRGASRAGPPASSTEDLPPEVVDKVKALMLHALTSACLGTASPYLKEVVRLAQEEEGKPDGATILGYGGKASRVGAAYANNEILHASGLVDSYRMRTHPGPVLIPAALANAELERRDGKDVITAVAAGYEFMCRLSYDYTVTVPARGFQPTSVFCTMGAALVTGQAPRARRGRPDAHDLAGSELRVRPRRKLVAGRPAGHEKRCFRGTHGACRPSESRRALAGRQRGLLPGLHGEQYGKA